MLQSSIFEASSKSLLSKKIVRQFSSGNAPELGRYVEPRSIISTYHFQNGLPRLPIPSLEETCDKYYQVVRPILTDAQFAETSKAIDDFRKNTGPALQQKLTDYDAQNKHTSYISEMWFDMYLRARTPLSIHYNPFLMFRDDPQKEKNEQSIRAATFILSSLRFRNSLRDEVLEPEIFHLKDPLSPFYQQIIRFLPPTLAYGAAYLQKSFPLDMSQYSRLFAGIRIPRLEKDELKNYPDSKHVVIMHRGSFYKVDVLEDNGSFKTFAEIEAQIRGILSNQQNVEHPVGILTTEDRNVWAKYRDEMMQDSQNQQSFHAIDSSLFMVCLDDAEPKNMEEANRLFLHGNGRNRWFDKYVSLIISKNGKAAVNFEHAWGDGVAVLRYVNEIFRDSSKISVNVSKDAAPTPRPLAWNLSENVKKGIQSAASKYDKVVNSLEFKTEEFPDFGKNYIKSKKLSPDGFVQMAYQLAYHRMYGKTVSTYESASTAAFRHGRTETIRPVSSESVDFVKAFSDKGSSVSHKQEAMKNAIAKHSAYVTQAATGKGVDRHLFALKHFAQQQGSVPRIFEDPAYSILNYNILSTSTLASDAIEGGGFGPVVPDGYGIGYGVDLNRVVFNITSYHLQTSTFINHIKKSLQDMQSVAEGKDI